MTRPSSRHGTQTWTSGAVALRRRHRSVTILAAGALLIAALGLTAAAAHDVVRPPIGLPGSGPAFVDAAPGVDDVGPVTPAPGEAETGAPEPDPAETPPEVPEATPPDEERSDDRTGSGEDMGRDGGTDADGGTDDESAADDSNEDTPGDGEGSDGEDPGDVDDDASDADESEDDSSPDPVDIAAVQARLRELGYLIGPADGAKGQQTVAAVMAFQQVNDLQVDGVVGPQTLAALETPLGGPALRGGPDDRIEVDLDRQILHLVENGSRVVTLKASSGNGEAYRTTSGGTAAARTPIGEFVIERRIHGVRNAALGTLYDPLYFHRGFAIHGSPSVPAGPASHGCVRVSKADAAWLIQRVQDGMPVHVYGGTHVFTPGG